MPKFVKDFWDIWKVWQELTIINELLCFLSPILGGFGVYIISPSNLFLLNGELFILSVTYRYNSQSHWTFINNEIHIIRIFMRSVWRCFFCLSLPLKCKTSPHNSEYKKDPPPHNSGCRILCIAKVYLSYPHITIIETCQ